MSELYDGIKNEESFGIRFYEYGEPFSGSHKGMRYRIERNPMENVFFLPEEKKREGSLKAYIWPEPYSFDKTDKEGICEKEFPFDEEGKLELVKWLNEQYIERKEEWKQQ